jgi:hypothetical protein
MQEQTILRQRALDPTKSSALMLLMAVVMTNAGCDDDEYGPYWTHTALTPTFAANHNSLSTSFTGRVYPITAFVFGPEEGFVLDKPNARLTINANTVWAYAPVLVELYDGPAASVGSEETFIAGWEIAPPELGGEIQFQDSVPLSRPPVWAVVEFVDFSGICILEILGHD